MKKFLKLGKAILSIVLCITLIVCAIPMVSANDEKSYTRLADLGSLKSQYLVADEKAEAEYPNGAIFFPVTSAELQMDEFYAVDIFRQGGTAGEASITVKTIDLTASYGEHYRLYTSNKRLEPSVKGIANPYYAISNFSFIPTLTQTEIVYETDNASENTPTLRQEASEINDSNLEYMPTSGEVTINFADGEAVKTIFIETLKSKTVTDDLEFMLTLSNPENCSISTTTTASFTIKENREKPATYIQVLDQEVNPDSDVAYVQVQRAGNLGGFDDFRFRTQSSTAKADESYTAVAMDLTFAPGMTEMKVPVTLLEGAEDGQEFNVVISDTADDIVLNNAEATVYLKSTAEVVTEAETAFSQQNLSSANGVIKSGIRGQEIVDLSQFQKSKNIGGDYTATSNSDGAVLKYENGVSCKQHAVSMVSKNKFNLTGVDSITAWFDIYGGSCTWDYSAFYVGTSDKFSDGNPSLSRDFKGIGVKWDMVNISSDYSNQSVTLDHNIVKGEQNIYLALSKGEFGGHCGIKFYNQGSPKDEDDDKYNMTLNLTKYQLSIINAPTTKLMKGGKLVEATVAENSMISDPAVTSSSTVTKGKEFPIYRNEQVTISSSMKMDNAKLKGVYICDPANKSNHSELITLDSSVFTLKTDYLEKYSDYIKDNKIVIQPVYEVAKSILSVEKYDNKNNGISFTTDSANCTGTATLNGTKIGTIQWEKSLRDDGSYYVGDEIKFTFTAIDNDDEKVWSAVYDTRSAETEQLLSQAEIVTYDEGTGDNTLELNNAYYSVTPEFIYKNATTKLVVTNPDYGDFYGKDGDFATDEANGSQIVTGYKNTSGDNILFKNFGISSVISFKATPNNGYRAKWTYRDAASHQQKVYYGSNFFFAVQNPYYEDDNNVTLTFEKMPDTVYTKYISGSTWVQHGSILNPPINDTATYDIAPNTWITMDNYTDMSDGNANFSLKVDPNAEVPELAQITFGDNETHRVLAYRNDQYYICDVNMSDYANNTDSTANIQVKLPYKTYGVTPTNITAIDADNNTYNDAITLVTAKSFRFDLEFSRIGENKSKPVNMVRWTVEGEDGINQSFDIGIEETDLTCHWANVISEIISPGEKLKVELFYVKYDSKGDPIEYSSYGKYDTGYTFIASSIEETITYMPEIGAESEASQGYMTYSSDTGESTIATPIPCIGPISPTVSLKGFTPIINMGSTGEQDEEGHDLHSVTIGIQFGKLKDKAQKDSKWSSMGALDKAKKLGDVLDKLDEINNSDEGFKKFGSGNAINMKTAVNLSFSFTFCFQANYYVDAESGEWRFVDSIFIAGAGGAVKVSIPFVVLYIPCFVFFTFEGKGTFRLRTEPEYADYLTLTQLESKKLSTFDGDFSFNIKLGMGLGVGFDGLLNAQGNLTANFDFQFESFQDGIGTFGLTGTVALELLFLKASWTGDIVNANLYTMGNYDDMQSQMLTAVNDAVNEEDILKNITLGDLVVNNAQPYKNDNLMIKATCSEKFNEATTAIADPDIIKLSEGVYLITSVMNCGNEENSVLHYYIYNSNTDQIMESGEVLRKLIDDMKSDDLGVSTDNISSAIDTIDHDVTMVDCGDDIFIMWNKSDCTNKDASSLELFDSVKFASVFYNKTTGKFHEYKITTPPENVINFLPKADYNENTGVLQVFYQNMDVSNITEDTTLEEVANTPTKLMTIYCNLNDSNYNWSTPEEVAYNNGMLQYYDVTTYGDDIMLSYVSSDTSGFVLEDFDSVDYNENYINKENFGTENALYIQQFSVNNNALVADKAVQISDEEYVVANPEFVHVKTDEAENTLLFYKCDGKYAYQNIDTLLSQAVYTDSDGNKKITEDYMEPDFVTFEEDHTVNDDYTIYFNEDGSIYSLWTTSEGEQQQIWARQFYIEDVTTITETPQLDETGTVIYDENGEPVMTTLDEPINILNGTWGTKNYLTEGGVGGSTDVGMFKSNFAAAILDNGDILTAYNSCDYEYTEDSATMINNQFIIAEYDPSADYQLPKVEEHLEFSDEYPNPGETVTITMNAKNTGINTGKDVQFTLYVNGEEYATKTVDKWFADEQKLVPVQYTLPENMEPDQISVYYTISENGTVKATSDTYTFEKDSKIIMTNAKIMPIQNVTDENSNAKFFVTVDVYNTGNVDYTGGDVLKFVDHDLDAEFKAIDSDEECNRPIYTSFGSHTLPEIAKSEKVTMKFVSEEVPKSAFEKNGEAANLEFVISQADNANWTTIEENDEYGFIDDFNIGYTQMPKPKNIKTLKLSDVTVTEGKSALASCGATPSNSLIGADVKFASADESIATVDKFGVVTGVSTGTTTITVTANGVEATATVTVKTANPVLGDVDNDGDVTIKDTSLLQSYVTKLCTENDLNLSVADVNGDGKINIVDVAYIQLIVAKYNIV